MTLKTNARLKKLTAVWVSVGISLCLLAVVSARAGTAIYDFNVWWTGSDNGTVGDASWLAERGVTNSGCVNLTDSTNQTSAFLLPTIDNGLVVKAFTLECLVGLGDWYGNPPGYGFSVNYARGTDPIIGLIESLIDPGRGGRTDGWAGNQDIGGTELNLPEEGTQTGIAVGFHTWGRGSPPVGGSDGSNDVRGISVRVDGKQVIRVPMPDILFADGDNHDYANDATTLITGPFSNGGFSNGPTVSIGGLAVPAYGNPDNGDGTFAPPALGKRLNWCPMKVSVDETGVLNLWWKGSNIVQNLQTTYGPGPGRIIFGASTGVAMEYVAIDDVKIVTLPSDSSFPVVYVFPDANGFRYDELSDPFYPNTTNLVVKLDGNTVTPTSLTNSGGRISLSYQLPAGQYFASGSMHRLEFLFQDAYGLSITEYKTFYLPYYVTVPSSYAVSGVDTTKPGFKVPPYQ